MTKRVYTGALDALLCAQQETDTRRQEHHVNIALVFAIERLSDKLEEATATQKELLNRQIDNGLREVA